MQRATIFWMLMILWFVFGFGVRVNANIEQRTENTAPNVNTN